MRLAGGKSLLRCNPAVPTTGTCRPCRISTDGGKDSGVAIRQFRRRESRAACNRSDRRIQARVQFGCADGRGVRLASLYVLQSTCTQQQPLMRLQGTLVTTVEGKCVHLRHRPAFHAPARHTRRAGGLQNISLTRSGRIVNLQSTSTPYPVPGRSAICQFCGPSASPRREYHSTATLIRLSSATSM